MIEVDTRGLSCPEPVVLAKKAFEKNNSFSVLVDNEVAKENVIRFCGNMKAKSVISVIKDGWKIEISK